MNFENSGLTWTTLGLEGTHAINNDAKAIPHLNEFRNDWSFISLGLIKFNPKLQNPKVKS